MKKYLFGKRGLVCSNPTERATFGRVYVYPILSSFQILIPFMFSVMLSFYFSIVILFLSHCTIHFHQSLPMDCCRDFLTYGRVRKYMPSKFCNNETEERILEWRNFRITALSIDEIFKRRYFWITNFQTGFLQIAKDSSIQIFNHKANDPIMVSWQLH